MKLCRVSVGAFGGCGRQNDHFREAAGPQLHSDAGSHRRMTGRNPGIPQLVQDRSVCKVGQVDLDLQQVRPAASDTQQSGIDLREDLRDLSGNTLMPVFCNFDPAGRAGVDHDVRPAWIVSDSSYCRHSQMVSFGRPWIQNSLERSRWRHVARTCCQKQGRRKNCLTIHDMIRYRSVIGLTVVRTGQKQVEQTQENFGRMNPVLRIRIRWISSSAGR